MQISHETIYKCRSERESRVIGKASSSRLRCPRRIRVDSPISLLEGGRMADHVQSRGARLTIHRRRLGMSYLWGRRPPRHRDRDESLLPKDRLGQTESDGKQCWKCFLGGSLRSLG
jgi:hypothetical protein